MVKVSSICCAINNSGYLFSLFLNNKPRSTYVDSTRLPLTISTAGSNTSESQLSGYLVESSLYTAGQDLLECKNLCLIHFICFLAYWRVTVFNCSRPK